MENLGNTHDHFLTGSHQRTTWHALIHCATASWSHVNAVYAWLIPLQTRSANFNTPVLIITFCDVRCSASDVVHMFMRLLHINVVKLALSLISLGFIWIRVFSSSQSVGALPATVFFVFYYHKTSFVFLTTLKEKIAQNLHLTLNMV